MDLWNYLAGGGGIGDCAACWERIKGQRFGASPACSSSVSKSKMMRLTMPWVAYLITHFRRSRFYDHIYGSDHAFQRNGSYGLVPYEHFGLRNMVFWNGWRPFVSIMPSKKSRYEQVRLVSTPTIPKS